MGIGLINIGSVGFENVACIFDESRLQRKCSIVTDLDVVVDGAKKSSQVAMDRGASRRKSCPSSLMQILMLVHSMPRIPLKSISQAKITTNVLFARS